MSQSARHSCTRLGLLGLGSLVVTLPLGANAEGFIDDAKATLNLRNAYFNRNFTNPTNPQGKAEEWTQNFILDAKSGFTQGTVGFGMTQEALFQRTARLPATGANGFVGFAVQARDIATPVAAAKQDDTRQGQ